jgi:hypothetical protein
MRKYLTIASAATALGWLAMLPAAAPAGVPSADPDRDGLSNAGERRSHTKPLDPDTDDDGVNDGDEDADRDGVDNASEIDAGTNPLDPDTDNDRRRDGLEDPDGDRLNNHAEDVTDNEPRDSDTDNDGERDGDERAGTVASFDPATGLLTIDVINGGSFTARVTSDTELGCDDEDENDNVLAHASAVARAAHDQGDEEGDEEGDDHSGPGGDDYADEEDEDHSGPGGGDDDADEDDEDREGNSGPGSVNSGPGSHEDDLDDDGEGEDEEPADARECTAAALSPGTAVHEAELEIRAGLGAVWDEVELVH